MEGAVALLARERERTAQTLKELEREEDELQQKLEGALTAAEAEPQNPVHRERGTHFQMRIQEIDNKQLSLTQELDTQSRKVEEYKGRLRSFMDEIEKLKKEQSEMVAVYVSTQQMLSLEDRLKGIGETAVDESIIAIREKVENMRARAKIAAEMGSTKTEIHDKNYEELGKQKLAESRFDELLKARMENKQGAKNKVRDLG
jgi:phage shock protein A